MSRWAWAVVALMTTGCVHRFECYEHGNSAVSQVTTEHFIVTGDFDDEQLLVDSARQLEQLWFAWGLYFGQQPQTPARLQVVLTLRPGSSEFMAGAGGFVRFGARAVMISDVYLGPNHGAGPASANAHELVHLLSRFVLPNQPRWLSEGLASYLGDAEFTGDDIVRMGGRPTITSYIDNLEAMWAWETGKEAGAKTSHRYESAHAWVHFLANAEETRFAAFLRELRTATSARAAFERIFPRGEWPKLDEDLHNFHWNDERALSLVVRNLPRSPVSAPRMLEAWEIHLLRRDYQPSREKRAEETGFALRFAPTPAPLAVRLAKFEDEPQHSGEEILLATGRDPRGKVLASRSPDFTPAERFTLAEEAVAALPDDIEAQARFAEVAIETQDPRALDAAARAIALAPWWSRGYVLRAAAFASLGRCVEARAALEDARSLITEHTPELSETLQRQRAQLEKACSVSNAAP